MNRQQSTVEKAYCAHGFPSLLCNICAVQGPCVHGMLRDCLLCSKRGLDSWFGTESLGKAWNSSQAGDYKTSSSGIRASTSSLKLGINERFRSAILLAAQRTGLDPAGIAAVINAEAAPISSSKVKEKLADAVFRLENPNRDWDKKPLDAKDPADAPLIKAWKSIFTGTAWDENSYNDESGAAGMTQFLKSTWRSEARRPLTYLNKFARENGYFDKKGEILGSSEGDLLDLRYDPTFSIVAAAEYDLFAFNVIVKHTTRDASEVDRIFFANHPERDFSKKRLESSKDAELVKEWMQIFNRQPGKALLPQDLTDDQKARYLYLCHHEGEDGAIQILEGSLTDKRAKELLQSNVPDKSKRDALVAQYKSESKAYSQWLWSYIDQHIQPSGFRA